MAGNYQIDEMIDSAINYLISKATYICFCTSDIDSSRTYANATNAPNAGVPGYCLAKVAVTPGAAEDGDTDGRKTVIPAYADNTVLGVTGTVYSGSRLVIVGQNNAGTDSVLYVLPTTARNVKGGGLVDFPTFSVTVRDGAAV